MTEEIPLISESGLVYIHNAGLVLFNPFLPTLFERLSYLKDNHFISEGHQHRAVCLLQYLATGQARLRQNEELALNKLLCGLSPETVFPETLSLTEEELKTGDSLLQTLIARWELAGSISEDGLRGSFLLREGRLIHRDKHWELYVSQKPFDLLLDKLPWAYSPIHFPFMKEPLRITWR